MQDKATQCIQQTIFIEQPDNEGVESHIDTWHKFYIHSCGVRLNTSSNYPTHDQGCIQRGWALEGGGGGGIPGCPFSRMLHALPPCSFARASNSKTTKKTYNFCSPQCAFAIIQPSMTQGQGESKGKLHTMNLVAASSHLTDMGFV